jgi:flagellar hook-basal body complex protein FliE
MQTKGIDDLIAQLQASASYAAGQPAARPTRGAATGAADFASALKGAVDQVNDAQQKAFTLARDFETGKSSAGVHEVMLSLQKANIDFQGTVQVRNKLVSAYQDIINMQI